MIPVIRPWFGPEEAEAAAAAVTSGWVAQGPRVAEFEQAFASAIQVGHGVAVSSCTAALHLALVVAEVGPGDEVVVPSLSFIATANVVRHAGAVPIFADIDPSTLNLTPELIRSVLTERTRAVILVDQGGIPADLDSVRALCDPLGITVIEDAACAAGSTYRGRPVGAGAELAAFSFHPRKLVTTGEGGMVTTSDVEVAARLRRLREHGMDLSAADRHRSRQPIMEHYLESGYNYRMTDVQAAIGLVQLAKLDRMVVRRRQLAERYRRLLGDLPGLWMAADPAYGTTNYQSFWVALPQDFPVSRDDAIAALADAGISARRGIMAAHLEPAFAGHPHAPLPSTEELTTRSLVLPLFHQMTESEQDSVVSTIRALSSRGVERAGPARRVASQVP